MLLKRNILCTYHIFVFLILRVHFPFVNSKIDINLLFLVAYYVSSRTINCKRLNVPNLIWNFSPEKDWNDIMEELKQRYSLHNNDYRCSLYIKIVRKLSETINTLLTCDHIWPSCAIDNDKFLTLLNLYLKPLSKQQRCWYRFQRTVEKKNSKSFWTVQFY